MVSSRNLPCEGATEMTGWLLDEELLSASEKEDKMLSLTSFQRTKENAAGAGNHESIVRRRRAIVIITPAKPSSIVARRRKCP